MIVWWRTIGGIVAVSNQRGWIVAAVIVCSSSDHWRTAVKKKRRGKRFNWIGAPAVRD